MAPNEMAAEESHCSAEGAEVTRTNAATEVVAADWIVIDSTDVEAEGGLVRNGRKVPTRDAAGIEIRALLHRILADAAVKVADMQDAGVVEEVVEGKATAGTRMAGQARAASHRLMDHSHYSAAPRSDPASASSLAGCLKDDQADWCASNRPSQTANNKAPRCRS
jgi:hypothetical protein